MNNFKVILKPNEEILKNLFAVEGFSLFLAYSHYPGIFVFFIQIFFFGGLKVKRTRSKIRFIPYRIFYYIYSNIRSKSF